MSSWAMMFSKPLLLSPDCCHNVNGIQTFASFSCWLELKQCHTHNSRENSFASLSVCCVLRNSIEFAILQISTYFTLYLISTIGMLRVGQLFEKEKSKRHCTRRTYKSHAVHCAMLHCFGTWTEHEHGRDKEICCELEFARAIRLVSAMRTHRPLVRPCRWSMHIAQPQPHAESANLQIYNRIDSVESKYEWKASNCDCEIQISIPAIYFVIFTFSEREKNAVRRQLAMPWRMHVESR